ncbi:MAG: glutaredoxin domain-containing protein [Candidatus Cohnella colombiensis]|uniref:Glutaredoxin domain-containing protein n=1 Tax=Candidatus Cohnella colombiensis TaxID=3121368 RepID=A0AA95EZ88_9BACL|nr:MAG: glutaredoxin domain-containing protein [Cohnella sp.]
MDIIVYTTEHCVSCNAILKYLQAKELSYRQLDVGINKENFNEMLQLGGIATPFIIIGTQKLHTFDRNKIEEVLRNEHG